MRRLSIQLTCLLALVPALGLGCAMKAAEDYAYPEGGDYYEEASPASADKAGGYAAAPGGYDFGEDLAEAEAPMDYASGDADGSIAMADELAMATGA